MSFTVLRVEVQQWEDENVFLPVGGQSEEGVEADDVVEEEGHQEDCGQLVMRIVEVAMFPVFLFPSVSSFSCFFFFLHSRMYEFQ